jgi:hypothetical protein
MCWNRLPWDQTAGHILAAYGIFLRDTSALSSPGQAKAGDRFGTARQLFVILFSYVLNLHFGINGFMGSMSAGMLSATILAVVLYIPYHRELANLLKNRNVEMADDSRTMLPDV